MKMEVRGFAIAYAKRKAKNKREEEKKLQAKLKELLSQSEKCKNNPQLRIHLQNIQMRRKRVTEQKVKGAIIRSKARWVEYGEKNTRYFLNLEKRRGEKKNTNKLKLNDGTETEDQEVIPKEGEKFYRSSNESRSNNKEIPDSKIFFQNKLIKPLCEESAKICEGKATKEECVNSLNENEE